MSINFGILVILIGSLIKRFDTQKVDYIFWVGSIFVFVLLFTIVIIVRKISSKTKEIKEL